MICPLGNWNSIYHKFRKWCANDVFENILQALVADTEKHGNQAIGVSRGGKNTKIHALVTENFQLIGLTGGQIHDSQCATEEQSKP